MDRVNGENWIDIGGGRRGFRKRNKAAGIDGTELTPLWFNGVQEELLHLIEDTGLTPDADDWTQIKVAITTMIADAIASHTVDLSNYYTKTQVDELKTGVVQRAYKESTTVADLSSVIPPDGTVPQSNEGTQILSVTIIPTRATNRIRVRLLCFGTLTGSVFTNVVAGALFVGAGASAAAAAISHNVQSSGFTFVLPLEFEFVAGVTSAIAISARLGPASAGNTVHINSAGFSGASRSILIVEEIVP